MSRIVTMNYALRRMENPLPAWNESGREGATSGVLPVFRSQNTAAGQDEILHSFVCGGSRAYQDTAAVPDRTIPPSRSAA